MNSALIKRLRKIATLGSEDYGAEPQDHSSWQAADLIERQAAQIVMLREALESANSALEFSSHGAVKAIHKALEATQDLSGLILCEAEPVRYIYKFLDDKGRTILSMNLEREGQIPIATIPLYQARTL